MLLVPPPNRRFLVDVDDVLADLRPRVLLIINEISGVEYTPDDFTGWNYFDVLNEKQKKAISAVARILEYFESTGTPYRLTFYIEWNFPQVL